MATYFHGSSEFQAGSGGGGTATPDGMQTLFLMNPNFVPYSDTTSSNNPVTATNLFFLNPAGNALNPSTLPHAPPPNYHHLLGLPLPTPDSDETTTHRPSPSPLHGVVSGVQYYNSWGLNSTLDHQNSFGSTTVVTVDNSAGPHDVSSASQLGLSRPLPVSPRQGLSLSLSSSQQQQVPYRSSNIETDRIQVKPRQVPTISPTAAGGNDMRVSGNSPSSVSVVSNGAHQSVVLGSKYLRAAQELLDEVVNVGKVIKPEEGTKEKIIKAKNKEPVGSSSDGENGAQRGPDLTTPQRQDLQMKKAKLVTMLDEVEQRYRLYRHQMQVVVSSLEQAAGIGAARTYAGLSSSTISKQFRCLRDAISGQIKAASKSLGEDDCLGVGSRLRYVDYQLRQQRALQHLGMIQHGHSSSSNAWRPQRGLPERAVSVLRAWLFEHFLHPYPKDSDKQILAKQTGLTRSQVSNWFINARVRLWKPMVEEMYLEEVKGQEKNNGGEEVNNANKGGEQKESRSSSNNTLTSPTHQFSNSTISTSPMEASLIQQTHFGLMSELDNNGLARRSPKRPRNNVNEYQWQQTKQDDQTREINMMMKLGDEEERLFKDGFSYLAAAGTGYAGTFNEEEQVAPPPPRFHGNSTVSLTLGLPHCDKLSLSGNPQNFLSSHNINSAWL